jgi:hypothetical protein
MADRSLWNCAAWARRTRRMPSTIGSSNIVFWVHKFFGRTDRARIVTLCDTYAVNLRPHRRIRDVPEIPGRQVFYTIHHSEGNVKRVLRFRRWYGPCFEQSLGCGARPECSRIKIGRPAREPPESRRVRGNVRHVASPTDRRSRFVGIAKQFVWVKNSASGRPSVRGGGGCEPRRGVGSPSEGQSPGTAVPPRSLFVPGKVRPNGPRVDLQFHARRSSISDARDCGMAILVGWTIRRTLGPLGRTPQGTGE